jgi:hypothetical protein
MQLRVLPLLGNVGGKLVLYKFTHNYYLQATPSYNLISIIIHLHFPEYLTSMHIKKANSHSFPAATFKPNISKKELSITRIKVVA